ncbi:MAG: hypothetical protein GXO79_04230 [Chlorobi bacterium]|nr:hypothetical protein [Chlorobiota bacterium]
MTRHKILPIFLILFLIFENGLLKAQQNNTLYFMSKIPQSSFMNPANNPSCNFYLGLPLISSIYFNYGNNGFAYNDLIYPDGDKLVMDIDNFFSGLQDVNNVSFDTEFNLFALGFKIKNTYVSLNTAIKADFAFGFPKGFFGLFLEGNGKHLGPDNPLDLSGFAFNAIVYDKVSLGLSRDFGDALTVGIRGNFYYGVMNAYTEKSDFKWYTDASTYDWKFNYDMAFRMAAPITVNLIPDSTNANSEIIGNTDIKPEDFTNTDNSGYGVDLGIKYKINRQLSVSASVIDLGKINWTRGVQGYSTKGEFEFTGIDVSNLVINRDTSDLFAFKDSILEGFNFASNNESYSTGLPTTVYLGASYFISSNWGIGVLYRSKFYNNLRFNSLTLSASTGLGNLLTLTGSYSIAYNSYSNFGLGLNLKLAMLQLYVVNDNVFGVIFPQSTRNVNMRFGLNITMGCHQKQKAAAKKEKDLIRQQEIDPSLIY